MSSTDNFSVVGAAGGDSGAAAAGTSSALITSNALGRVQFEETIELGGHPKWCKPAGTYRTGLKVHNSLTSTTGDELVEFIPANGRKVMWYTCGPTVYNSAHMGHARAYLTLDILRRIMEDYFGYDLTYQINITDIDDKIILKARRNKLIADFEAELGKLGSADAAFAHVAARVDEALSTKETNLAAKLQKVSAPLKEGANSRDVAERDTQIKETELKTLQLGLVKTKAQTVRDVQTQGLAAVLSKLAAEAKTGGAAASGDAATLLAALNAQALQLDDEIEAKPLDDATGRAPLLAKRAGVGTLVARAEALVTAGTAGTAAWQALLAVTRDEVAELIDAEKGDTVTDHTVFNAHARHYEREFLEEMSMLGVHEPDVLTRVTEYVPKIISFVETIVGKGLAYASNGSVYLSIEDFKRAGHDYRKLVPSKGDTTEAEMAEGEGALGTDQTEKRSPNDFALWKASKPGEPAWDSPWGQGRPGWHIECSVVASDILGHNMDIHAGGSDLKFPHHDNELAQSEACFGCQQWVNYFFHAGHLHIKGLKMSKSLKNFITIRQALQEHSARQLRIMFLLQPWNKPMNYSDQTVGDAKSKEALFNNFFGEVKTLLRRDWLSEEVGFRDPEADRALMLGIHATQTKVHDALCENFNTPSAMLAMCDLVSDVNKYLRRPGAMPNVVLVRKAARYMSGILRMLGVIPGTDEIGFQVSGGGADKETTVQPFVQALIDFRNKIKAAARDMKGAEKQAFMAACDAVRDDTMTELGVRLEDKGDQTSWKLDDPATLKREIAAKKAAEEEKRAAKAAKAKAALAKDLEKWEAARVAPAELFRTGEHAALYSEYGDDGVPTKDKEGKEIQKSAGKKLQKLLKVHTKAHEQLKKKAGDDIDGFIAGLRADLEKLSL